MPNAVENMTTPRGALPNTYTNVSAREIDFVEKFGRNWKGLQEIIGIMRPIKKASGTRLVAYTSSCTLQDGEVPAGAVIPYSKTTIEETMKADVKIEKYAKAVTIEEVDQYGAEVAIEKSDDAFRTSLQNKVMTAFYTFLADDTYALTGTYATWQMCVAMAVGKVRNKFQSLNKDITNVVVFVNTLDAYAYLGAAGISTQTAFGIEYVKNFMGASPMILTDKVASGKVIAVPVENIDLYYADPSASEFAKLGLVYRVEGETNLIGFHANGNYSTAVGESFALMGMTLFSEVLDGIAICTVDANPS